MASFYGEVRMGFYYGLPVEGRITSRFGARDIEAHFQGHTGVDIANAPATKIGAPQAADVFHVAVDDPTFGNWCILKHDDGTYSLYGHMLTHPHVDEGDRVEVGDIIGRVGSTGVSTGAHLHWGHAWRDNPYHRRQGKLIDPLTKLWTPDERWGDTSPPISRVPLIMRMMTLGLRIEEQPRDVRGRASWNVKPGGGA